jgi:hypothetical protein
VDEYLNVGKLIGLLGLFLFARWRRATIRSGDAESDAGFAEVERDVQPPATGGDCYSVPWGIASALRDAVPKRTVVVGRGDCFVRCEELNANGREVVRATMVDRHGKACGAPTLHVGSLDEHVSKLI